MPTAKEIVEQFANQYGFLNSEIPWSIGAEELISMALYALVKQQKQIDTMHEMIGSMYLKNNN